MSSLTKQTIKISLEKNKNVPNSLSRINKLNQFSSNNLENECKNT